MTEEIFRHVAHVLWDVFFFVIILFALVLLLIVLRGFARMSYGVGLRARRVRLPRTSELEDLPPYAKRRAELAKDKTARRSWFGFLGRKV